MAQPAWQLPVKLLHAINSSDSNQLLSSPAVDWDMTITIGSCTSPALNLAVERASIDVVRFLLSQHCSVTRTDSVGNTALHCASLHDRTDVATLLLATRAKVNAANSQRSTPLHLAALHGNTELFDVLLSAGANPSLRDMNGATPLHLCCARGHADAALLMLESGAAPDARMAPDTDTPLHVLARSPPAATSSGECHLVAGLVTRCPKLLHAVNSQLCTALDLAVAARKVAVVEVLLECGASWHRLDSCSCEQLLYSAAAEGRLLLLGRLLAEGSGGGAAGREALLAAYRGKQWAAVQLLLSAGVGTGEVRKAGLLDTAPISVQQVAASPAQLAQLCRLVLLTSKYTPKSFVNDEPNKLPLLIRRYLNFDVL